MVGKEQCFVRPARGVSGDDDSLPLGIPFEAVQGAKPLSAVIKQVCLCVCVGGGGRVLVRTHR